MTVPRLSFLPPPPVIEGFEPREYDLRRVFVRKDRIPHPLTVACAGLMDPRLNEAATAAMRRILTRRRNL